MPECYNLGHEGYQHDRGSQALRCDSEPGAGANRCEAFEGYEIRKRVDDRPERPRSGEESEARPSAQSAHKRKTVNDTLTVRRRLRKTAKQEVVNPFIQI